MTLAVVPLVFLMTMLVGAVYMFGDSASSGPAQIALLMAAGAGVAMGLYRGQTWQELEQAIVDGIGLAMKACLILLEKSGERRRLRNRDFSHISADGDYVRLITPDISYIHKETLSGLEQRLSPEKFKRVNRSHIVNGEKIVSVSPKSGGAYEIQLEGGRHIQSSRPYKTVVESILPKG